MVKLRALKNIGRGDLQKKNFERIPKGGIFMATAEEAKRLTSVPELPSDILERNPERKISLKASAEYVMDV